MQRKKIIWNILKVKAWFDKGFGVTSYAKYLVLLFGIVNKNLMQSFIVAGAYALFCLWLGWAWFRFKLVDMETEIQNRANPFVREVRRKI